MSIRKKATLLSIIFLISLLILVFFIIDSRIRRGFDELENIEIGRAIDRSVVGINNKIVQFQNSSKDWAEWNDMYNFALGKSPRFIKDNISENQFIALNINYMVVEDNNGKIVYQQALDLLSEKFIAPDNFLSELSKYLTSTNVDIISGIFDPDGIDPTLIVIRPILKTGGIGTSAGKLIFARKIDGNIIRDISTVTSYDFSLFKASDVANPSFSSEAVKSLEAGQNIFIDKSSKDIALAFAKFKNELNNENLILRVALTRDIYKNGISVSFDLMISLLLITFFAVIVFVYILNALVIKRISFLANIISDIDLGRAKIEDIVISGKDEIAFLANKLKSSLKEALDSRQGATFRAEELEKSQKAILNVLEDIEAEKNRSESLVEDLQKFKLAVENASDHIIITDANGIILFANKGVEKITGYSLNEVIGKRPSLWGKQMPKEFYENLWKTIKQDKVPFIGEVTNRRKNGELYIAESNISPILNSRGDVVFFVGIERDITKIKEINQAKTEFVSVASHQLRTPLTGIKWLTEILLKNKENNLTSKQIETLEDINFSNDRVINLVNDLLSISRIEGGKTQQLNLKPIELVGLIDGVIKEMLPIAEHGGVILTSVIALPKDLRINIDEDKIRQSVFNLISNAIKYCKSEGGRVEVLSEIKNGEIVFSVKDNGIGIPLKDQRRIFDKFYRADNALLTQTEGTGLGLFIVKSYIEAHGGRIWFESEENKGTTFYVVLPAGGIKKINSICCLIEKLVHLFDKAKTNNDFAILTINH